MDITLTTSPVTTEVRIVGMTCGHCERAISSALLDLAGVVDVAVDLAGGTATVVSRGLLDPVLVGTAVVDAGYDMEWAS